MRKASNEIDSAVFNQLQCKADSSHFEDVHFLRLEADGCQDKNKNTILLSMYIAWLERTKDLFSKIYVSVCIFLPWLRHTTA